MSNPTAPKLALADAIRVLAMDAVQKANSGHPGAPMGMAEIAQALWLGNLRHNPADPAWANRDRFVLSNGHGSMLIYALLHLTGYDLPLEELKNFRQLHSRTPGHPEVGITPGVETTTGPLGQGLANAVGMALAEALLAAEFNRAGHTVVDHHTYVFLGDGCLMEGISHEACSLAGTLKLSKLVALYDDNGISIDGHVEHWFADDTATRFEGYGWNVIRGVDGHDVAAVDAAIKQARAQSEKPTLIVCRTVIGKGSPNMAGTHNVHGAPLGNDEIAATRAALGWSAGPFEVPQDIYAAWDSRPAGALAQAAWEDKFQAYAAQYPAEAAEFTRRMKGELPEGFAARFEAFLQATVAKGETVATRKASQFAIAELAGLLPEMLGGSADLTGSNFTDWKGVAPLRAGHHGVHFGRHINYGVREFGMAAIMNGIALHGGYLPFGGTFLTFSDYSRNAIRMAALMKQRVVHVFTHDSIGLGEDGPTHQPVEHLAISRATPNTYVFRPADTVETAEAWELALTFQNSPSVLSLTRQNLPTLRTEHKVKNLTAQGGYVLAEATGKRQVILIATGSEVEIAMQARATLEAEGIGTRVVSMPCMELFAEQDEAYRKRVLPAGPVRVGIEAAMRAGGWDRWLLGERGREAKAGFVGMTGFGASAPAEELYEKFGITAAATVAKVKDLLG